MLARYDTARVLPVLDTALAEGVRSFQRLFDRLEVDAWPLIAPRSKDLPSPTGTPPRTLALEFSARLPAMTELAHALRDTLLALTRIASPIGEEAELCDHVEDRLSSTSSATTRSRASTIA